MAESARVLRNEYIQLQMLRCIHLGHRNQPLLCCVGAFRIFVPPAEQKSYKLRVNGAIPSVESTMVVLKILQL